MCCLIYQIFFCLVRIGNFKVCPVIKFGSICLEPFQKLFVIHYNLCNSAIKHINKIKLYSQLAL